MQLVAYGAQDIYLTGNPQITFFKVVYRRHTNFSMEAIQQSVNGSSTLTASPTNGTVTISRNGDLVHKIYVQTTEIAGITAGWEIISDVELEIGGQKIDKHDRTYLACINELTIPESKALAFKAMTGSVGTTGTIAAPGTGVNVVQVPLQFWFCRNPGLALPLIALQYHEVKLKFTWGVSTTVGALARCDVYCDYIYLDTDERRRFAQQSHEYLIEQVQRQTQSVGPAADIKLNFNHPVKELIWTSGAASANHYTTAQLKLNGHDRFSEMPMEYFQLRQPLDHHTSVPRVNLPTSARISLLDRQITLDIPAGGAATYALEDDAVAVIANGSDFDLTDGNTITLSAGAGIDATVFPQGTQLAIVVTGIGDAADFTTTPAAAAVGDMYFCTVTADATGAADVLTITVSPLTTAHVAPKVMTSTGDANSNSNVAVFIVSNGSSDQARTSRFNERINVYSFALKPEEHQPSGTCNFSRIDNAKLKFTGLQPAPGPMEIYAINYNVLRIMSGMGGLAYSN